MEKGREEERGPGGCQEQLHSGQGLSQCRVTSASVPTTHLPRLEVRHSTEVQASARALPAPEVWSPPHRGIPGPH